jgi:general secretion pathway protein D
MFHMLMRRAGGGLFPLRLLLWGISVMLLALPGIPAPAAEAAPARVAESVEIAGSATILKTDGPIEKFRYFALEKPPRLVVDIYQVAPRFNERVFNLEDGFTQMRLGLYPDKTRFVFDTQSGVLPQYAVAPTDNGLVVSWAAGIPAAGAKTGVSTAEKPSARESKRNPFAPLEHNAEPEPDPRDGGVSLDFKNIELADLIKTISDLTGRNFTYDDTIKGQVTIITPETLSHDEAYHLFLTVLSLKGYTVVPSGKTYKIVRDKDAKESNLPLFTDDRLPAGEQFVTRLIRLNHIDAAMMAESVLAPLVPKSGQIVAYPPANTLIITDNAANIERLVKIIRSLDVPSSIDRMEVIPLEFANAEKVAALCQEVLDQNALSSGNSRAVSGAGGKTYGTGGRGASRVLAYERTNSLVVMASRQDLETVRSLVARLDRQPARERSSINVYYLENADAEKLAETLNEIATAKGTPVGKGNSLPLSGGSVNITADKPTNALIINATPEDYELLKGIIARLDIKRKQVYVEALILELSMEATKTLGMALQGAIDTGDGALVITSNQGSGPATLSDFLPPEGSTVPSLLGKTIDGILLGGLFNPITVVGPDGAEITVPALSALIDLSKKDSDINILSAPRLLTSDNEEAEIIVGANVPIITERLTDTGGSTGLAQSVAVERQDVALTLRFTPQITEGDLVRLNVYQEITNIAQSSVGDIDQVGPTLTKRLLRNTVLAEDGQTVVLGGLIANNVQDTVSKVPLLGDIPVLGWLFKHNTKTETKTNLLIFITPRIIKNSKDLARVTNRSREAMERFRPEGAPPLIPSELLGSDLLCVPEAAPPETPASP